jgi:predicted DNA-binding transcriptional regulator AlpA
MATAVPNSIVPEARRKGLSLNIIRRVQRTLEQFDLLPDDALIDVRAVSAVRGRSVASTWRDVAQGRLSRPVKVGGSTRFRVGDVRADLKKAARHD